MAEQGPKDYIEPTPLDRVTLAACLGVNLEAWEGKSDDEVRQRAQTYWLACGPRPDGRVTYHPEEQVEVTTTLLAADRPMLERGYIPGLFADMIRMGES